jgi:hypothetical protein
MLGSHPSVAAPIEMGLFLYLHEWNARWQLSLDWIDEPISESFPGGLMSVMTQDDFDGVLEHMADLACRRTLAAKEGSSIVLDKRGEYVFWTDEILRIFPQARFIHLIRDGRDVAASLIHAGRSWAPGWAPRRTEDAAAMWRDAVLGGLNLARRLPVHEVRYEDLVEEGPSALAGVFEFLDLDPAPAAAIHESLRIDVLRGSGAPTLRTPSVWAGEARRRRPAPRPEVEGFIGIAKPDGWRTRLNVDERLVIDQVAGELLRSLGYVNDSGWVGANRFDHALRRVRSYGRAATLRAWRLVQASSHKS